jgi:hypothetical protein
MIKPFSQFREENPLEAVGYKEYVAIITPGEVEPTVQVLKNDFGTVDVTRLDVGDITIENEHFDANHTHVSIGSTASIPEQVLGDEIGPIIIYQSDGIVGLGFLDAAFQRTDSGRACITIRQSTF